jgi:MoaA/NifB/PqqE/SkfB family radical SAM enzyme
MSDEKISHYVNIVKSADYNLWKHKKPLLSSFYIELTERCNNNCIHCYINLPKDDPVKERELSTSELKAALDEAASLGCMLVMFTGGEPLLRDDFEELYIYTRRLGMSVTIKTNATLITPCLVKTFRRMPPGNPIVVTLYGMSKNAYDRFTRTPGSNEACWRGIDLLIMNEIPFELSFAVTPFNLEDIDAFEPDFTFGYLIVRMPHEGIS